MARWVRHRTPPLFVVRPLPHTESAGQATLGGTVDYGQAKQIGDLAEAQVSAVLEQLQPTYGFVALHDILISKPTNGRPITAQLDHVVVDQSGALIIETKARNGALIRGTYADSKWTAIYQGGRKETFQNPLKQNEQHLNLLHQALRDAGITLPLDSVRGLVVMVGADISQLELDSITAMRVTSLDGLPKTYAERDSFMIGVPLDSEAQASLVGTIRGLDRSNDPSAVQAHVDYRQPDRAPAGPEVARPASRWNAAAKSQSAQATSSIASSLRLGLFVLLALGLVGFGYWAYVGMRNGTAPLWLYVVLFVIVAALGEEGSSSRRRKRRRSNPAPRGSLGDRLVAAFLTLILGVALAVGGYWAFTRWVANMTNTTAVPAGLPATPAPRPSVEQAKTALREAQPDLYAKLVSPDKPLESTINGYAAYTWEYMSQTSDRSVQIRKITIMLDAQGRMIGVDMQ